MNDLQAMETLGELLQPNADLRSYKGKKLARKPSPDTGRTFATIVVTNKDDDDMFVTIDKLCNYHLSL